MLLCLTLSDWHVGLLAARSVHDLYVVARCLVRSKGGASLALSCSAAADRFMRVLLREAEAAYQKVDSRVRNFGTVFVISVTKHGSL